MRLIVVTAVATSLAVAAPAIADTTSSATPDKAGRASELRFDVDGLTAPNNSRIPLSLNLVAPGFKLNPKAVARRCSEQSAKLNECPKGSIMGTGRLKVIVTAPDPNGIPKVRDANIKVTVFRGPGHNLLALAYVFGWQVVPGTVDTTGGVTVNFSKLPQGPPFEGVSYRLRGITFTFAAKRVVTKRKRVKGHVKVTRRTVHLIHNPRTCKGGSWASMVTMTYADGSPQSTIQAPTPCTG
jgi:hypothetical protein